MLRDTVEESGAEVETEVTWTPGQRSAESADWRSVDRALRRIAHRRAALDADEARWLREAEALQIWRPLGMVSMLDYLERACGYSPRTAQDRLRVARALGALPQLAAALASGRLAHSAVRELTRVATPATEAAWLAAATGKILRQIEELVAEHRPGDRPDDPPDPRARMHAVRFELSAETFARLRQTRAALDDEHGTNLDDDAFIASLCGAMLDGAPRAEPSGRAKFQIAVTVCQRCRRGWQDGAGAHVAIDNAALELAMCDAQHIGSIDGAAPTRARQDIPPRTARAVWRRDGGRCRVDGCRSSRGLEIHHIIHRADGGSHDASNLILACSACHLAHHRGALTISGTADHLEVRRPGDAPVGARAGSAIAAWQNGGRGAHVDASPGAATRRAGTPAAGRAETSSMNAACVPSRPSTASRRAVEVARGASADGHAPGGRDLDQPRDASRPRCRPRPAAAHVETPGQRDVTARLTEARAALTGLGWKPAIAHATVAAAAAAADESATLDELIVAALRRCPVPRR